MGDMEMCFIWACENTGLELDFSWGEDEFICSKTRLYFRVYCLGVIDGRKGL